MAELLYLNMTRVAANYNVNTLLYLSVDGTKSFMHFTNQEQKQCIYNVMFKTSY